MTRRLLVAEAAEENLRAISHYIAERSGRAIADAVRSKIVSHCQRLADLPGTLGTDRADLLPDLRSTPHKGYIIYFRYTDDAVEVVNVLDARRDALASFDADQAD